MQDYSIPSPIQLCSYLFAAKALLLL
uniref:Uncharacterized protein n=1 Tax=Arundo donax TaxID=35708 RepID=A0A0A9ATQ4_ARUDO